MDAPLRIELLGWLRIKRGDRVISQFRTQKTSALLAYLALFPERHHAREALVDLLWPEADLDNGLARLSKELWSLRSELKQAGGMDGDRAFITRRLTISLDSSEFTTDVAEFCSLLDRSAGISDPRKRRDVLKQAVDLYRGELLPGLYEDWVLTQREHVATRHQDALRQLTALSEEVGDVQDAIAYAQLAITADPLWEQSYLSLARLFAKSGQYARAMRQYEELERVLSEELGAKPSAEAAALFRKLKESAGAMAGRILEEVQIHHTEGTASGEPASEPLPVLHPLPLQLTRFFGREDEILQVSCRFTNGAPRLLTLLGPSGAGKTRLAVEIVERMASPGASRPLFDVFAFVPLADISDAGQIPAAIADALRIARSGNGSLTDRISEALASRRTLLVLDNLEHIAEEAAVAVHSLLESVPGLAILATSRRRLCLPGEQCIPIPQLPVPTGNESYEELMLLPSIQLFADRARTIRPDFRISDDNLAEISTLCRKLEGIPLAIELCAAWSGSMTPADLIGHLDRRFDLLVNQHIGAPARHRSLQAAIDYSYRQLTPELQRVFACLSVFRGGWTSEAACAIISDRPGKAALPMLKHLSELRERSMVQSEETPGEMRFRMLETLREFGQEQRETQDLGDIGRRHAEYYRALAERAHQGLYSSNPAPHLVRLDTEHDNLRAALAWCLDTANAESGLGIAVALTNYWTKRSCLEEGKAWFDRFLALGQGAIPLPLLLDSLRNSGRLAGKLGDSAHYRSLSEQGLEIARSQNDRLNTARALHCLGSAAMSLGNYEFARKCTEESFEIYQSLEQQAEAGEVLNNLGLIISASGDYAEAKNVHLQALRLRKEAEYQFGVVQSLLNLCNIALEQGDYPEAHERLVQAVTLSQELDLKDEIAYCLEGFASIASCQSRSARAAVLAAAAGKIRREMAESLALPPQSGCRKQTDHEDEDLNGDPLAASLQKGESLSLEDAIAYARAGQD